MNYIAKFNPYNMDDATVLAVATGRKALLRQVLKTLADNLTSDSIAQHLLIRGPRGMGKSFFLKYLQIHFRRNPKFNNCDFLLLPEEQNNIHSPTDLLKVLLGELKEGNSEEAISLWEEPEGSWAKELQNLKEFIKLKRAEKENYQLVVVIENLDEFLSNIKKEKKTRELNESRFRHLLEKLNHLTIIGATPRIDSDGIDRNYNQRLFHAFKKCNLKRWQEEDYTNYLERRRIMREAQLGKAFTEEQLSLIRAKLKAISHYTGGSPRMAVVLTNLLLEDDVLSTVKTMMGLIDDLTPYYQDITKSIPTKSKILFDTLIRKGENISQSELAGIVGATQSKISKAFLWLKDNGYIIGKKRSNSPAFSYYVADRIHVLYYKLREVHHNKNITPIWLFSDFLVAFYQEQELKEQAIKYLKMQPGQEANDLARLYLLTSVFKDISELPEFERSEDWLDMVQDVPVENERIVEIIRNFESFLEYKNEEDCINFLQSQLKELVELINYDTNNSILGKYFIQLYRFMDSLVEKDFLKSSILVNEKLLLILKDNQDELEYLVPLGSITLIHAYLNNIEQAKTFLKKLTFTINESIKSQISKSKLNKSSIIAYTFIIKIYFSTIKFIDNSLSIKEKNDFFTVIFHIGSILFILYKKSLNDVEIKLKLNQVYVDWLNAEMPYAIFQDLCEEALTLFPQPENQLITQAALNTIKYLESEKKPAFLETLNPDMAIAVQAIIEEAKLG